MRYGATRNISVNCYLPRAPHNKTIAIVIEINESSLLISDEVKAV